MWSTNLCLLGLGMLRCFPGITGGASVLRVARVLRVLRTARMARLVRLLPELMILIKGHHRYPSMP